MHSINSSIYIYDSILALGDPLYILDLFIYLQSKYAFKKFIMCLILYILDYFCLNFFIQGHNSE